MADPAPSGPTPTTATELREIVRAQREAVPFFAVVDQHADHVVGNHEIAAVPALPKARCL